jgi:hypothetical protein
MTLPLTIDEITGLIRDYEQKQFPNGNIPTDIANMFGQSITGLSAIMTLSVNYGVGFGGGSALQAAETLAETGITSISLATTVPTTTSNAGNTITATSTVTFADATTSTIANVILTNTQIETKYLGDGTVSAAANDNSKFFDHQRCA